MNRSNQNIYSPILKRNCDDSLAIPAWRLVSAVNKNKPLLLLLDGYNVISHAPETFARSYEQGRFRNKARNRLAEIVAGAFCLKPCVSVQIYFDSHVPSEQMVSPNVLVKFSGGGREAHRADNAILSYIDFRCCDDDKALEWIITDDYSLAQKAAFQGVLHTSVQDFWCVIKDIKRMVAA